LIAGSVGGKTPAVAIDPLTSRVHVLIAAHKSGVTHSGSWDILHYSELD
jgi:hypothetical protein